MTKTVEARTLVNLADITPIVSVDGWFLPRVGTAPGAILFEQLNNLSELDYHRFFKNESRSTIMKISKETKSQMWLSPKIGCFFLHMG